MAHLGRIQHQRDHWKKLKEKMSSEDLLILADWSEKYQCKYHIEVQSTHFGGSHEEISLHTGMVTKHDGYETFCTISECTKQGPLAIVAHLKPILERHMTEETTHLHFLSDGPTTQYRSKKMFYAICKHLRKLFPQIKRITWNYSESGHGKNVADGAGAVIKTQLDRIIAHGKDLDTCQKVVAALTEKELKTYVLYISEAEVLEFEKNHPIPDIKPFKGTLDVHQACWEASAPSQLTLRKVSCYDCYPSTSPCSHYVIGQPWKIQVKQQGQKASRKPKKTVKKKPVTKNASSKSDRAKDTHVDTRRVLRPRNQ